MIRIKGVVIFFGLFFLFIALKFYSVVDINEIYEFKSREIFIFKPGEFSFKNYEDFRIKIEVFNPNSAIEENLKTIFKEIREKASKTVVSSDSFLFFQDHLLLVSTGRPSLEMRVG